MKLAELAAILVCPKCKQSMRFDGVAAVFLCAACHLRYRVVDGVPDFVEPSRG